MTQIIVKLLEDLLISEITYKAIRSSGSGGQHVNKVSSKVVLSFALQASNAFSENEKKRLYKYLDKRLSKDGVLQLSADDSRHQHQNKKKVKERFLALIEKGLFKEKKRRKTKPSYSSVLKTKAKKKQNSEKKSLRQKPKLD